MTNLTRLLGGRPGEGRDLRYGHGAARAMGGALPDTGPVVVWNWTRACNLHCVHCYASAQRGRADGELATHEAVLLLDQFADLHVPALILSGGEPLMRPDALELLAAARERGLRCTLSTNGTLITEDRARQLAAAGVVYVGISIDGPSLMHDRWRGQRGAYDRTMAAVGHLRRLGVRVGLRFTLHADNVDHVPWVLDLVEAHDLQRICFYHLVPAGRGEGLDRLHLDRDRTRATLDLLLERTFRWLNEGRDAELLTVDNHSDGPYAQLWCERFLPERAAAAYGLLARNGGNRSGRALIAIDPLGRVHPDQFSSGVVFGDVHQARLRAILTETNAEAERFRDRAGRIRGRCATCRWFSLCNGNLRARAAAAGDPWGPDPDCVLTDDEIALDRPG